MSDHHAPWQDGETLAYHLDRANGCCGCGSVNAVVDHVERLEKAVRVVVRLNDSPEGAVGDVRSELGDEAADTLARVLRAP